MTKFSIAGTAATATLLLAALTFGACVAEKGGGDSLKIGAPMPEFSVSGPGGSAISTAGLVGEPTLVVLFRTTCPDCNREMPTVEEAWKRISAINTAFHVVAISREDAATVAQYWEDAELTMPWYLDPDGSVFTAFDVHYVPTLYLFGSDGKVAYAAVETFDFNADALVELIEGLK